MYIHMGPREPSPGSRECFDMVISYNSEKFNPFICGILIVLLVISRMIFPNDFSLTKNVGSDNVPTCSVIKSDISNISHEVLAKENTISGQANEIIRTSAKETGGYERTAIRLCILALLISIFYLFASLKSMYLTRFIGRLRQKLSIIIYIHNSDGRKRCPLS